MKLQENDLILENAKKLEDLISTNASYTEIEKQSQVIDNYILKEIQSSISK